MKIELKIEDEIAGPGTPVIAEATLKVKGDKRQVVQALETALQIAHGKNQSN